MGGMGGAGVCRWADAVAAMSDFDRYRPAMAIFFAAPLVMAVIFGAVVISGGSPVRPEFYGPVVYAIPALTWVSMQLAFTLAAVLSCSFGWPKVAAVSAWLVGALFLFFATAATAAGATGTLLVAMSVPSGALSWLCALVSWRGRNER
jgi:hypothetical protein